MMISGVRLSLLTVDQIRGQVPQQVKVSCWTRHVFRFCRRKKFHLTSRIICVDFWKIHDCIDYLYIHFHKSRPLKIQHKQTQHRSNW